MSKLLDFLFGKDNNIFNKKGVVQHDIGGTRWDQWKSRFKDRNYDFTKHRGRAKKLGETPERQQP